MVDTEKRFRAVESLIDWGGCFTINRSNRDNRRMDIVVTYGREEFIVELKILHGEKYEQTGREQLSEYFASRARRRLFRYLRFLKSKAQCRAAMVGSEREERG